MSSEPHRKAGKRTRTGPVSARADKVRGTRDAIVAAALDVFTENGFAAARMDEVAARAGVAKGTLYLHFEGKEALFEAILAETLVPVLRDMVGLQPEQAESSRGFAERVMIGLWRRLNAGRGADVVRLIITEGPRFPRLAEAYYRTVVEPGLGVAGTIAARAEGRGGSTAAVARFPQLLLAPAVMGLLWGVMFERFAPLDVEAMMGVQLDLLFGPADAGSGPS